MSQTYLFPILNIVDLVPIVHDIWPEVNINESDFRDPQAERWTKIYLVMLQYITGTQPDQFNLLQFQAEQAHSMDYPELYEDATSLVSFTMAMQRFMFACGVKDFKLRDLTEPKPKRTQRNICAIVNFYRFQSDRTEVYENIKAESDAVKEQYQQLTTVNDEIQQKINTIKSRRAEKQEEFNQLQGAYEEMRLKLGDHHKQQVSQQKAISDMKAGIAERTAAFDQLKLAILSSKEAGDKLSRQIVQSPDRMKNEMERQRNHLSGLKVSKEEKITRLMELREQENRRCQLENDCEQAHKLVQGINTEIEKHRDVLGEISNIHDKIQAQNDVLRDHSAKEQQQKQMMASKHEKISKLSLQHQNRVAAAQETVAQYQQEKETYCQLVGEDDMQKTNLEHERLLVEQETGVKIKRLEKNIGVLQADYSQLLEKLETYHENLALRWEPLKIKK